ncbi:MAG: hypothetical protein ACLGGX_07880 [Bdellovibrionia bacterium]
MARKLIGKLILFTFFVCIVSVSQAAAPKKYQVNLRVGLKGTSPFAVNTAVKSGKKASFSEISSDGLTETRVELTPRKSRHQNQDAVFLNIKVAKFVQGQKRAEESLQILAIENQEAEAIKGRGHKNPDLSVSVMTHSI